jgi:DNA-binding beta-propeller fold protein YncE
MDRRRFLAAAAAAPLALAAPPAALGRLLGGTPLALVTADLESAVVAVGLSTGRVVRRITTPPDPRSIESIGGTAALVAHVEPGRLTLIGSDLRVRGIRGLLEEPRYAAVASGGRHAYVTDSGRGELVVVDLEERAIVRRLRVGGTPRHLAVHPSLPARLWVVLGNKASEIAVVDARVADRPRVVGRVHPPFLAHDVGYEPRGARVWVTSGDRRRLAVYDDRGTRLLRTLRSDAPPQHVTFLGGRALVASGDDGLVRVRALGDGRVLRTLPVPLGSYNVQEGWGVVLNPSLAQGTLTVIGRERVLRRLSVARSSHDACFVMVP